MWRVKPVPLLPTGIYDLVRVAPPGRVLKHRGLLSDLMLIQAQAAYTNTLAATSGPWRLSPPPSATSVHHQNQIDALVGLGEGTLESATRLQTLLERVDGPLRELLQELAVTLAASDAAHAEHQGDEIPSEGAEKPESGRASEAPQ
jgi:hypothetical protein